MINCTETPFLCYSQIDIVGINLHGTMWFVAMMVFAFILQISANFIWLRNSQISREILQYKSGTSGRGPLIWKSIGWTALSTIIGIFRVIFIIGNNLWLYIVILLGNVIGTAAASYVQSEDEDNTLDVLISNLEDENLSHKRTRLRNLIIRPISEHSPDMVKKNLLL